MMLCVGCFALLCWQLSCRCITRHCTGYTYAPVLSPQIRSEIFWFSFMKVSHLLFSTKISLKKFRQFGIVLYWCHFLAVTNFLWQMSFVFHVFQWLLNVDIHPGSYYKLNNMKLHLHYYFNLELQFGFGKNPSVISIGSICRVVLVQAKYIPF